MAKTKGQIAFEKAQANLKKRIQSAEKAGFEINKKFKDITTISYKSISPQRASSLRKSISEITTARIRSSKSIISYTTEEGKKLSAKEYGEYRIAEAYKSKAKKLINQNISGISKKYKEKADELGEKQAKIALEVSTNEINTEMVDFEGREKIQSLKDERKAYYAVANWLKGAQHSLNTAVYGPNQIALSHMLDFMKRMNYEDAAAVISALDKAGANLVDAIYSSDYFELDGEDEILSRDLNDLQDLLSKYGYKGLTETEINRYVAAGEKIRRKVLAEEEGIRNQIIAYNKSVWLSRQK